MNSITGKSTGIALLMAAALLAALFSMGVFSATGVGAHGDHEPADNVTPAEHLAQLDILSAAAGEWVEALMTMSPRPVQLAPIF